MKLKVLRPGYRLGNRVLRPARVEVRLPENLTQQQRELFEELRRISENGAKG